MEWVWVGKPTSIYSITKQVLKIFQSKHVFLKLPVSGAPNNTNLKTDGAQNSFDRHASPFRWRERKWTFIEYKVAATSRKKVCPAQRSDVI